MSQEILTGVDNSLPAIRSSDSKDRRMVSKNRWARGARKCQVVYKNNNYLEKEKTLKSKAKKNLIRRKTKDGKSTEGNLSEIWWVFFFLKSCGGRNPRRQIRQKRGENGERGGVMDVGRGPAALCQHLHASFQTSHCAAICLPDTHTNARARTRGGDMRNH